MSILQPWLWFDIVPVVMRFAVALLLIIACSEQPRDTSPTRLSEAAPAKPDAISKSPSLEKTLGSFLQEGIPSVAVLELGSYQSLAVMRIVPTNRNRSEIQCELFYLKHGKKLVASGVWDSAAPSRTDRHRFEESQRLFPAQRKRRVLSIAIGCQNGYRPTDASE